MGKVNLYSYQEDAIERLNSGDILCGGVGSGKSRTAIVFYIRNYQDKNLVIITTARKRDTYEWEDELKACGVDPVDVRIDSWNNIKKYTGAKDSFFIFDEQRLVGSGAWVKAFLKIVKENDWILLSATPGDTWMDYIPVFIANGFYKNRTAFINEHIVYKRFSKFPQVDRYINEGKLLKYRKMILVNMDFKRSTNSHHEDIWIDYDREKYRTVMRNRWNIWEDLPITNASEYCQALRRVVNTSERRREAVLEVFREHPRVIIFYNYNYELELLRALDYGKGVKVAEWNGHKHMEIPRSKSWVYLVQYTAGAEGWNCIETDTVIFFSLNYSYKVMKQAAGRIDRLNTPYKDLYYYHFKSKSGIDLGISRALQKKKKFNETKFSQAITKRGIS